MRVRSLDANHDWNYGKGKNDYLLNNNAIIQNINTRLQSFINDCFFDAEAGLDWWNLLGGKSQVAVELAVTRQILNSTGVTALSQLSVVVSDNRNILIQYQVVTVYSLNKSLSGSVTIGGSNA